MKMIMGILDRFERWVILACFSTSLVALTISIVTRYVFKRPLTWPDELTTYLFMLMTFLGASASVKNNTELKVDALYVAFPFLRFPMDIILNLIRLLVSVTFVYAGWQFVKIEIDMETVTPILQIPTSVIATMLPVFGVILGIRSVDGLCQLIFGRKRKGE